ncbi:MAG: hypothetical protein LM550_13675, partial [Candidatus Contendobacter sp.]|nr:hypothetical protein [Candidatus Contendobacter sp.]
MLPVLRAPGRVQPALELGRVQPALELGRVLLLRVLPEPGLIQPEPGRVLLLRVLPEPGRVQPESEPIR